MTLQADSYNPLMSGVYELTADLVANESYALDDPIAILVMVQNKALPTDIVVDNSRFNSGIRSGEVLGTLKTIDPVDNSHTYSIAENADVELDGDKLIWKGGNAPLEINLSLTTTDRAGQQFTKNVAISRELKRGEFLVYPNPAYEETNVLVELERSASVSIRVFDAIGRLVLENSEVREGTFTQKFDLKGLAAGTPYKWKQEIWS